MAEHVKKLALQFIKSGNLIGQQPGFAHALKLGYNQIDKTRLSVDVGRRTLTYRYRFSEHVPNATAGILTAMMDELTTIACFALGGPCPPGASVQMHTEVFGGEAPVVGAAGVDAVSTVVKTGRVITNVRTEFLCASSGRLLALSTHVKYMPTGSRILDLLFASRFLWGLYARLRVDGVDVPLRREAPLLEGAVRPHLELRGAGRATFRCTAEHVNPMGTMHGGCHAVIMEQVGAAYARSRLGGDRRVFLGAIHIEFLRPGRGDIDVECETIVPVDGPSIYVRVSLKGRGKNLSVGKLRFHAGD